MSSSQGDPFELHPLQVLPAEVPQLEDVDIQTAEYSPLADARQAQLTERSDWCACFIPNLLYNPVVCLRIEAYNDGTAPAVRYQRLSPEATGSASEQQFSWAVSVSRACTTYTFAFQRRAKESMVHPQRILPDGTPRAKALFHNSS